MEHLAQADDIVKVLAIEATACIDCSSHLVVTIAAGAVKMLQGKAHRIRDLVASSANRILTVSVKTIARRPVRRLWIIDQGEIHIRRWRGNRLAQQYLAQRL